MTPSAIVSQRTHLASVIIVALRNGITVSEILRILADAADRPDVP